MAQLKLYRHKDIDKLLGKRPGETKLGETLGFISHLQELEKAPSRFVLFGIPEDIGVRANYGKPGTSGAWKSCLGALVNVQENFFNKGSDLLLLGEIDCRPEMEKASNLEKDDPHYFVKLGELVERIDEAVSATVSSILQAGKIPLIVGGGHNNAFGNIKGASLALQRPLNVINLDAHTDLRTLEHRHSGNGFSYALEQGFLGKYSVFGLHQNYTPQYIFEQLKDSENLSFTLLEDLLSGNRQPAFQRALESVGRESFGLEVDCDVMAGFPSSAISPSGFTLHEVREMIIAAGKNKNCCYLHLCEAVDHETFPTGKALSFMLTDFIKARSNA